jgi:hypothetical protein
MVKIVELIRLAEGAEFERIDFPNLFDRQEGTAPANRRDTDKSQLRIVDAGLPISHGPCHRVKYIHLSKGSCATFSCFHGIVGPMREIFTAIV